MKKVFGLFFCVSCGCFHFAYNLLVKLRKFHKERTICTRSILDLSHFFKRFDGLVPRNAYINNTQRQQQNNKTKKDSKTVVPHKFCTFSNNFVFVFWMHLTLKKKKYCFSMGLHDLTGIFCCLTSNNAQLMCTETIHYNVNIYNISYRFNQMVCATCLCIFFFIFIIVCY